MYNNYREGRDLKQLQTIIEKREIYEKLAKNRILDSEKKGFFINELKKEMSEIIEKRKV